MHRTLGLFAATTLGVLAFSAIDQASADSLKSCTNASWEGTYGFKLVGERIGGSDPGPRAGVGEVIADGRGNISGIETKSRNGVVTPGITFNGTYNMLTDCTGTGSVTMSDTEVRNFYFVLVERSDQVLAIQTDQGRVVTITATKQRAK